MQQQLVVLDTTKVQIFKQITTLAWRSRFWLLLFQIPQRYRFSSKSQHKAAMQNAGLCCFRYHKGTDFQANHNLLKQMLNTLYVVLDTTKVQIFKQITTPPLTPPYQLLLFQIPQRYRFSSKSQHLREIRKHGIGCFRYHKGTDFQANHNRYITVRTLLMLFQIPQRYRFSSKSQQVSSFVLL